MRTAGGSGGPGSADTRDSLDGWWLSRRARLAGPGQQFRFLRHVGTAYTRADDPNAVNHVRRLRTQRLAIDAQNDDMTANYCPVV